MGQAVEHDHAVSDGEQYQYLHGCLCDCQEQLHQVSGTLAAVDVRSDEAMPPEKKEASWSFNGLLSLQKWAAPQSVLKASYRDGGGRLFELDDFLLPRKNSRVKRI